jgi:hypothetical protein
MEHMALKKIIDKKKKEGKTLSPVHKEARSTVLEDLMDHLSDMGMDKVKGLKKVTVASDSKEGLAKGLNKATEMVEKSPMEAMEDEDVSDHGANEVEENEEESEDESESEDDIRQKIEELKAKLEAMKA